MEVETEEIKCRKFKDLWNPDERDLCPKYQGMKKLVKRFSQHEDKEFGGLSCEYGNCFAKCNQEEPNNKSIEHLLSRWDSCLGDAEISWGAKGLFCYLLSMLSDGKTVRLNHMEIISKDNLDHTNTLIIELMEHEYLKREMIGTSSDKGIQGYKYIPTYF